METLSQHPRIGLVDYKLSMTTRGINILLNILALLSLHPSNLNQPLMQILAGLRALGPAKVEPEQTILLPCKIYRVLGYTMRKSWRGKVPKSFGFQPEVSPCSVWQQCPRYRLRILDCRSAKIPPDRCKLEYHKLQGV